MSCVRRGRRGRSVRVGRRRRRGRGRPVCLRGGRLRRSASRRAPAHSDRSPDPWARDRVTPAPPSSATHVAGIAFDAVESAGVGVP